MTAEGWEQDSLIYTESPKNRPSQTLHVVSQRPRGRTTFDGSLKPDWWLPSVPASVYSEFRKPRFARCRFRGRAESMSAFQPVDLERAKPFDGLRGLIDLLSYDRL